MAVNSSAASHGPCTISVGFPSFTNSAITASVPVSVLVLDKLRLVTQHYDTQSLPADAGSVTSLYTSLKQISCIPTDWQQATVWLVANITNGSSYDVTPAAAAQLVVSNTTAAKLIRNVGDAQASVSNRLRPLLPGSVTLNGKFANASAPGLSVTLGGASTAAKVQSVKLVPGWCTSGSSNPQCAITFADVAGSNRTLEVQVGCVQAHCLTAACKTALGIVALAYRAHHVASLTTCGLARC